LGNRRLPNTSETAVFDGFGYKKHTQIGTAS
jgi:hypothetical protein